MTQITLGNTYQSGGKTVVGGSQSQIDTEGLINALADAKRAPAVQLENKNKTIDSKTTAYTTLKSLLTRFQTAADTLRNPPGVNNATQNIFQYRTSSLTSTGSTPASSYMSVTVEPGAANQSFSISEIHQLALETKQDTGTFSLADTTTASVVTASGVHTASQFSAGTFTLRNIDSSGSPVSITLNDGDSLQAVVNKFNAVKGSTGMQANILKVASGTPNSDYKIVFTATQTGTDYGFDLGDSGTVLSDPDGALSMISFHNSQLAQNAQMTVDGVAIERQTNSIDDLIDGLTFNLTQKMTDGTKINAVVKPDTDIVKNAITQFADIYNEFRLFAAKQQQLGSDGLPTADAVLSNETQMRNIISQVASEATRVISGITGGDPSRLADIGVNFSDFAGDETNPPTKNIMVIDTDKLSSALESNFDGVRGLFEYTLTADNPNLTTYARTNALNISAFTIFRDTDGSYKGSYVDSNNVTHTSAFTTTALSLGGITLTGQSGSVFEGLQMIYAADVSGSFSDIHVNISQGYGDRFYNLMNNILDTTSGSLTQAMQNLSDQKTRNETEINNIDTKIVTYREQLTQRYAALEAALTKANNLLSLLDAQSKAQQANG